MKKNNQSVAAIIVTYNRLELLKECLVSVACQTRLPDEIIVAAGLIAPKYFRKTGQHFLC